MYRRSVCNVFTGLALALGVLGVGCGGGNKAVAPTPVAQTPVKPAEPIQATVEKAKPTDEAPPAPQPGAPPNKKDFRTLDGKSLQPERIRI